MAADKDINPILKQVLELGPTVAFFLIYLRLKEKTFQIAGTDYSGFIVATLVFIPILLAAMGVLWALTGKLSRMQIFTAFMVIFFGGLTAWFNDERFFKMKTTLVYGVFAILLGIGLMRGRSYLAYVLGDVLPMRDEGWMILTRRLCGAFTGLAVANELVWRNMSTDLWVKIETFGFPILLMGFIMLQFGLLQAHMIDPDQEQG
ncbi:septation protein IspZ [Ruegeria pomeroyi]|jgi:intracellular septation protein|uniref:Inner membrane-spanning protein YciB n=2 Tax=Ruegeria pomeroyi TaxID=89184 RepID=Q5LTS6_RUEPO|nr:inner membrane-spanning protein YciB [Ruegeria pomeroyi]HCE72028.1 septation protein IspZ [Ruegeria sp.]AAV94625.1 intracellular septation protein A [Ruegeria pomeroyi DSS-3]NVK98467.1 septation protein IspZ [Ruegeria pomeroyi]NVL03388.1 septation protein IspZ [Ruegeria pomeroyi]QWV08206.1 septation protein IspZ [Ruegeria pomeroyi]